jgi:hypothetical protein
VQGGSISFDSFLDFLTVCPEFLDELKNPFSGDRRDGDSDDLTSNIIKVIGFRFVLLF